MAVVLVGVALICRESAWTSMRPGPKSSIPPDTVLFPDVLTRFAKVSVLAFSQPYKLTRAPRLILLFPVASSLNSDPGLTVTGASQVSTPDSDLAIRLASLQAFLMLLHSPRLKAPSIVPVLAVPRVTVPLTWMGARVAGDWGVALGTSSAIISSCSTSRVTAPPVSPSSRIFPLTLASAVKPVVWGFGDPFG